MHLSEFEYHLPKELIADHPVSPRDHSRLLVVNRKDHSIQHARFYELRNYLSPDDFLILNDTKVIPARLKINTPNEGEIEILLIEETSPNHWLCIGKPAKKMKPGDKFHLTPQDQTLPSVTAEILKTLPDGQRVIRFYSNPNHLSNTSSPSSDFHFHPQGYGELPLPPYIQKQRKQSGQPLYLNADQEHYQTVYASSDGSVAAPTAGLHFTPQLLQQFPHGFVTLHVGLGTFRPVKVHQIQDHEMHSELFEIPENLSAQVSQFKRIIAVGTTVCRVLETQPDLKSCRGQTNIFITPPYSFKRVDGLLTNFHLPGSTLLMLVAAFTGIELQRKIYAEAIKEKYRFYSYGDAMLIL